MRQIDVSRIVFYSEELGKFKSVEEKRSQESDNNRRDMTKTAINNELNITLPEGFHEMDEAEKGKMNFYNEEPGCCFSDPDRHMVLSVSWKKNLLGSILIGTKEVAANMEKSIRKPMAQFGYSLQGYVTEDIGGAAAEGFRYSYTAEGIEMTGESLSAKKGRTFYYIHCYMRTELLDESTEVLKEILKDCEWQ